MTYSEIQIIERYFDLELSEEELKDFEDKMENNHLFSENVKAYKLGLDELDTLCKEEQKERMDRWESLIQNETQSQTQFKRPKSAKVIVLRWVAGIAASIMIFVVGKQFIGTTSPVDMASALQVAWDKEVGLDYASLRSTTIDTEKAIIMEAYHAFDDKAYDKVMTILKEYPPQRTYYEDALFLQALSRYKKGEINTALQTLDKVIDFESGRKREVAKWYKGLIYLGENDLESAKKYIIFPQKSNDVLSIQLKE